MSVLLIETKHYQDLNPVTITRFSWEITVGCFSSLERLEHFFPKIKVYSGRFTEPAYTHLVEYLGDKVYQPEDQVNLLINAQYIPADRINLDMDTMALDQEGRLLCLRTEAVDAEVIGAFCAMDTSLLSKKFKKVIFDSGVYLAGLGDLVAVHPQALSQDARLLVAKGDFISPSQDLFIAKTAQIDQYVSLNPGQGPVVIDSDAHIRPFSIIDGPAYIGKKSLIDSAKIRSHTTIRDYCRIGGEVEASIIESYTNKHHEGFIGHSYLGSWVNIGAIATTSDLKNNYSQVRLQVEDRTIPTGQIKVGSIICDYSRVGIGMMLNTGTVIAPGVNLFQQYRALPPYLAPFQWGLDDRYDIERFLADLAVIMQRRNILLSEAQKKFLEGWYQKNISVTKNKTKKKA